MATATTGLAYERHEARPGGRVRELVRQYSELSKARLSSLVLLTTAVGFAMAEHDGFRWGRLVLTLLATALAAFGVNALNQRIEVERDRRMLRTCRRPLPAGAVSLSAATWFGVVTAAAGPVVLALWVNWISAGLTLLCELVYVAAYTPLKPRTPLNTLVGAVCGALPPMIGWAAATGGLERPAWILGAILFVWQIPHFLALAWLYREDYARGGFEMLSTRDRDGRATALVALLYSALLVPVSMLLSVGGPTGALYGAGAALLGAALLAVNLAFCRRRTAATARRLFLASVVYLPLLLGLMVADRGGRGLAAGDALRYVAGEAAPPAGAG
ncbi:MAG: heme o synthase [Phycisphaerae bacterium]|nr:protoheme IX farnesyltransferase [Phycisphaerae bacterium]MCZ2401396.1 heme o synthase [Phycisphaerae bacterium]